MKISVVIPVFNEENYIENCLLSLVNQEEKADEIIVVDNNCSDKTINIAKKYPVKIIKEKKQGTVFARNKGFNEAKGEILARCDADSILSSDWIKKIKKVFQEEKIDGLTGPVIFYDLPFKTTLFSVLYMRIIKFLQKGETLLGPNMAITKKIWNKIKNEVCLNEKRIHEDIDLSIHILRNQGKIKYEWRLFAYISARRIKNKPFSFFLDYPKRAIINLLFH